MIRPALFLLLLATPAFAHWNEDYANQPPEVRKWYRTRVLNVETQKRLGVQWNSCCDHSDTVKTKFRVERTTGGDTWFWWDNDWSAAHDGDGWRVIPADTIHWGEHAPEGKAVLFAYQGIETCFFPADGGI